MENKQTAVDWLYEQLPIRMKNYLQEEIIKAKEMEKQQTEEKDDIINEIDFELSMIEDYTHGEVGKAITNLRHKIQQYYKTIHGK